MTSFRKHHEPLPLEARKAIWNRLWDRLLRPLPTEVVVDAGDRADLPDHAEERRTKELPR